MPEELTYDKALLKIASLCSITEYCEQDILKKLQKWGMSETESSKIISYLKKEKYIDESRYAKSFVRDKFKFAKWGTDKISFSLKTKKISESVIKEALLEINENEYKCQIENLILNKFKSIKYKDLYDAKVKLYRFGMSRGFESNLLMTIINKIIQNTTINNYDDII